MKQRNIRKLAAIIMLLSFVFSTAAPALAVEGLSGGMGGQKGQLWLGSTTNTLWRVLSNSSGTMFLITDDQIGFANSSGNGHDAAGTNAVGRLSSTEKDLLTASTRNASKSEIQNVDYGFISNADRAIGVSYWLRTGSPTERYRDIVQANGSFAYMRGTFNVRPTMTIADTSNVLFTSRASTPNGIGGKGDSEKIGSIGIAAYDGSDGYKMTLKDTTITSVTVSNQAVTGDNADVDTLAASAVTTESKTITLSKDAGVATMTLNYTGGLTGADNYYVSALVYNKTTGNLVDYGNVARNSASGTGATLSLANLDKGEYTIKFFNEKVNGDYKTDYGSALTGDFDFSLTGSNVLGATYKASGLTVNMSDWAKLGFEAATYDTKEALINSHCNLQNHSSCAFLNCLA